MKYIRNINKEVDKENSRQNVKSVNIIQYYSIYFQTISMAAEHKRLSILTPLVLLTQNKETKN